MSGFDDPTELRDPLTLALLLMGQDCEPAPAPTNFYCAGAVAMPDPDGEAVKAAKRRKLVEMKKRGVDLSKHYRQAFDYWVRLVEQFLAR